MKQSLQLKIGPSLAMTPQLQQAIRLLQLSSMELSLEVQQALDSNMMLELDEDNAVEAPERAMETEPERNGADLAESLENNAIPEDLPIDTAWEDIYGAVAMAPQPRGGDPIERADYDYLDAGENSLRNHLLWQLNLTTASAVDQTIAVALIDSINDDGYLTADFEEIQTALAGAVAAEPEEIEAVLRLVQSLEPVGVGARNLAECLSLQLAQLEPGAPWLEEARVLVGKHLELLGRCDYKSLMKRMKLEREELQQVIELVQSLDPRPGNKAQETATEYVAPDVFVKKANGAWKVELNADSLPRLRINAGYANMIRRADSSADNVSLKNHLQEARWFIKSLQSRSETLLRVASCIVERQRAFLEHGEEAMKPLVLRDVAESLELHESTVSRVTTRKYMHTPRGLFELKRFFSSHVNTAHGGVCSSTAIRALIKKLVQAEKPDQPLSDSKIANLLRGQGIRVARRTIAKYRETLSIPSSSERKRLV